MKIFLRLLAFSLTLVLAYMVYGIVLPKLKPTPNAFNHHQMQSNKIIKDEGQLKTATFAGGCFWCMEPAYQEHPGVFDAIVGYSGGSAEDADYKKISTGKTLHREVVQVSFDPKLVSYEELLEIFWRQIDPTDDGGQFADRGYQYTTAIYYHDETQKEQAEKSKKEMQLGTKFNGPIATKIEPYKNFFLAEEYHQDYYQKSAQRYKQYKKGSGREGYLEDKWGDDQPKNLETQELENKLDSSTVHKFSSFTKPSPQELKESLTEIQYKVTQKDGTERPFDNPYWDNKEDGIYVDIVSGEPLFSSTHKYKSGTGWPSFWQPIDDHFIVRKKDWKLIYPRTEIRSKYANSHIGHVFSDGPDPTGLRYCMNSAAMRFVPKELMASEGYESLLSLFE